jgi:hypothetical protein
LINAVQCVLSGIFVDALLPDATLARTKLAVLCMGRIEMTLKKENMSKSAFSSKVFSIYLFIVGAALVIAPNTLLSIFQIAPTSEVWIRVVGVVAFNIGIYAWVASKHEDKSFLEASVYTRFIVFLAFTSFAVLGLASPMIVLFGIADLLGAMWTRLALKADAKSFEAVPA